MWIIIIGIYIYIYTWSLSGDDGSIPFDSLMPFWLGTVSAEVAIIERGVSVLYLLFVGNISLSRLLLQ